MADEIIQGNWDDLVTRQDLHGRRVRVIVLDNERDASGPTALELDVRKSALGIGQVSDNPWLNKLRAWADSHKSLGHSVDDSRENIYSGTVEDPR
jgi:hypothetical protein